MANEHELTPAEQKRLEKFEEIRSDLESRGYKCTELIIGLVWANAFSFILFVPVAIISMVLYLMFNSTDGIVDSLLAMSPLTYLLFVVILLALVVVHELIHGATWAIFAEHHFKDIEFGFIKKYLTPYCTCKVALAKGAYILGALMPLIILGIIPVAIAIAAGSLFWLWMGIIMITSASGDILIVHKIVTYKTEAGEILYYDHPTNAGGVIFEK